MASAANVILLTVYSIILFPFSFSSGSFYEELPELVPMKQIEKKTHLHFYFHDIVSGKNATVVRIAGPSNGTLISFGNTMMMDDPLTEGPELSSKLVGKAQGIYALAEQHDFSLLMVMNFVFTEGKYNGSSISILGRNHIMDDVREMPIVGGSGSFRLARGYALAHTVSFASTGDVTVEYNVYVITTEEEHLGA